MTTQTIQNLLETIYEANSESCQVNNPKWWLNTMELVNEEKTNHTQWQDLVDAMSKLIKTWNRFSKTWAVTSSTILITKLQQVPGGILAMLLPLEMMSNYLDLWNSYASMVNQELTECLDSQLNTTISMSSTTVPSATVAADAPSAEVSNLSGLFAQPGNITDLFGSLQSPTGTMSSFISTVTNGEHVKFGIEEPVGEYRLAVSIITVVR